MFSCGALAEAVSATVISVRLIGEIDAAAHARLHGDIAWCIRLVLGGECCYIGAIRVIACCYGEGEKGGEGDNARKEYSRCVGLVAGGEMALPRLCTRPAHGT